MSGGTVASVWHRWALIWHWLRLIVGGVLLMTGVVLLAPQVLPALGQGQATGQLSDIFLEPAPDDPQLRVLRLVFTYRVERSERREIHLGHHLADPSGRLLPPPVLPPSAAAALMERIAAAGGAERLPVRVFVGGEAPARVYCPFLVGDRSRWQAGVVCLAIPIILLLFGLLHHALRGAVGSGRRTPAQRRR